VVTNTNNGAEGAKTATAVSNAATVTVDMAWNVITPPSPLSPLGIATIAYGGPAGGEKFFTVGSGGAMAYSDHAGVTWTAIADTIVT
jgi:hypothetical protein